MEKSQTRIDAEKAVIMTLMEMTGISHDDYRTRLEVAKDNAPFLVDKLILAVKAEIVATLLEKEMKNA